MLVIEVLAVVFTLLCVYLATKNNIWNWPIGIIGVLCYFIVFLNTKLYSDMLLQIVFFIQGLYGWWYWVYGNHKHLEITKLSIIDRFIYIIIILLGTPVLGFLMKTYTDASIPFMDAFTTTISVVATFLLAFKKLENWVLWVFVDIVYVGMFLYKELYLSSILYLILGIIAFKGLLDWNKKYKEKLV